MQPKEFRNHEDSGHTGPRVVSFDTIVERDKHVTAKDVEKTLKRFDGDNRADSETKHVPGLVADPKRAGAYMVPGEKAE